MENDAKKILVVDDDENIRQLIKLYLSKENFAVSVAGDGPEALRIFEQNPPNLVVLDIMLPGMDGWDVCREIRKTSTIPIIMLSAKGESFDKVLGLELGADDYLVKPFDPKELVARIRAVLRRVQPRSQGENRVVYPNLLIDLDQYLVRVDGQDVDLAPKEIELLYFLGRHPNQVFTREQLLEQIWGFDFLGDSRTVDVHVQRLRQKVKSCNPSWSIKTVWGVGYKFEVK